MYCTVMYCTILYSDTMHYDQIWPRVSLHELGIVDTNFTNFIKF